ncbi:HTH_Tnp_Tc3_2 domain-containing protein [Trichonephila clavipes]|nr:HTH_Tnp_Tc3_2 domain-containing protein [Trichonephila clavipes]
MQQIIDDGVFEFKLTHKAHTLGCHKFPGLTVKDRSERRCNLICKRKLQKCWKWFVKPYSCVCETIGKSKELSDFDRGMLSGIMFDLSDVKRGMVIGARLAGAFMSRTTNLVGVSRTTVSRVWQPTQTWVRCLTQWRKLKLKDRDRRVLKRIVARNRKTTLPQITSER